MTELNTFEQLQVDTSVAPSQEELRKDSWQ